MTARHGQIVTHPRAVKLCKLQESKQHPKMFSFGVKQNRFILGYMKLGFQISKPCFSKIKKWSKLWHNPPPQVPVPQLAFPCLNRIWGHQSPAPGRIPFPPRPSPSLVLPWLTVSPNNMAGIECRVWRLSSTSKPQWRKPGTLDSLPPVLAQNQKKKPVTSRRKGVGCPHEVKGRTDNSKDPTQRFT